MRRFIAGALFYCVMVSFTFGYVLKYNDCYANGDQFDACDAGPFFAATFWPFYWVYHSGQLAFEPSIVEVER